MSPAELEHALARVLEGKEIRLKNNKLPLQPRCIERFTIPRVKRIGRLSSPMDALSAWKPQIHSSGRVTAYPEVIPKNAVLSGLATIHRAPG
jgi:hypothetical protein